GAPPPRARPPAPPSPRPRRPRTPRRPQSSPQPPCQPQRHSDAQREQHRVIGRTKPLPPYLNGLVQIVVIVADPVIPARRLLGLDQPQHQQGTHGNTVSRETDGGKRPHQRMNGTDQPPRRQAFEQYRNQ